mmetsp:Transcript_7760/g.27662  ORF Transcript_7760/g.27662 Transcript_7760/m.27662 type:complete len:133 (-) Transcript_7760:1011-1409(-)
MHRNQTQVHCQNHLLRQTHGLPGAPSPHINLPWQWWEQFIVRQGLYLKLGRQTCPTLQNRSMHPNKKFPKLCVSLCLCLSACTLDPQSIGHAPHWGTICTVTDHQSNRKKAEFSCNNKAGVSKRPISQSSNI